MVRLYRSVCAILVGILLGTHSLSAQTLDEQYRAQVIGYLNGNATVKRLLGNGFKKLRGGLKTGYIVATRGSHQDFTIRLEQDYAYAFIGECDEDCRDLDFVLYDPNGAKVAEDADSDDSPGIWLLVPHSGTYTVRATIPGCDAPVGCYWAIQAVFK